jgi:hypothetical protein
MRRRPCRRREFGRYDVRTPRGRRGRHVGKECAAKARNHSRVASALPHSEDIAYKPLCGEIAMCPRVGRMGVDQVMTARDSITRARARTSGVGVVIPLHGGARSNPGPDPVRGNRWITRCTKGGCKPPTGRANARPMTGSSRLRARCPGHPRLTCSDAAKTWMAGTSPAMTAATI